MKEFPFPEIFPFKFPNFSTFLSIKTNILTMHLIQFHSLKDKQCDIATSCIESMNERTENQEVLEIKERKKQLRLLIKSFFWSEK